MWTRRLVLALVGTAVLAVVGTAGVWALSSRPDTSLVTFPILVIASLVWLPVTRRWNARAHLCWSMNFYLFVVYLAFMLAGRCPRRSGSPA